MPFGPGDFADIAVRLLAQKLAERTQVVVIENRPSVGGLLAANAVTSAPDSCTLFSQPITGLYGDTGGQRAA